MGLPGGLVLRGAQEADLDQIGAVLAERGEDADAVDATLVAHDPGEGLSSIFVVVDGARVVATATLLQESVTVGSVPVPAGQVELVATDRDYEGRGLVRALMAHAHAQSAARGDLLQVMIGIPFFYRQFGYAYAMPIPLTSPLRESPTAEPGTTVRRAVADDLPAMVELQDRAQAGADIQMPHSEACWRWLLARDGSTQLVAERDGVVVGTCRTTPPEEGVVVGELAGDADAARTLVAHANREALAHGSTNASVMERAGTPAGDAVEPLLALPERPEAEREWYYARIERLGPLLHHLGPVLTARATAAGVTEDHAVLLSSWRSHVRFTIGPGGMSDVAEGGPEQAPVSQGGSGVPPDVVASLLLGPHGAIGLEERHPDAYLGRQRDLMAALFPPLRADLLTFYLPC